MNLKRLIIMDVAELLVVTEFGYRPVVNPGRCY